MKSEETRQGTDDAPRRRRRGGRGLDWLIALALTAAHFLIYNLSVNIGVADSAYTLLGTEMLIDQGTFFLDEHFPEGVEDCYQLTEENGHIVRVYPTGPVILSVPLVLAARAFGWSSIDEDGIYQFGVEAEMQTLLASLVTALAVAAIYALARVLLSRGWAIVVAVTFGLGSPMWSTLALALWSDTWGVLLLTLALVITLRHAEGRAPANPVLLGTLLAWAVFCKPTFALSAAAVTVYLLVKTWRRGLLLGVVGALWFALFVAWSHRVHGSWLPGYYVHGARWVEGGAVLDHLAGIFFSPSRGVFVFMPWLVPILAMAIVRIRALPHRGLLFAGLAVMILTYWQMAIWLMWWGGWSHGPRLSSGLLPWFALFTVATLHVAVPRLSRWGGARRRVLLCVGAVLLILSAVIHLRGANVMETILWQGIPVNVDHRPERNWEWSDPVFLAPFGSSPLPEEFPPLRPGERIHAGDSEEGEHFWEGWLLPGWGGPGTDTRWACEEDCLIIFGLPHFEMGRAADPAAVRDALLGETESTPALDINGDGAVDAADLTLAEIYETGLLLRLHLRTHPEVGDIRGQRLRVRLNGERLAMLLVQSEEGETVEVALPPDLLRERNTVLLDFRDGERLGAFDWLLGTGLRSMGIKWFEVSRARADAN